MRGKVMMILGLKCTGFCWEVPENAGTEDGTLFLPLILELYQICVRFHGIS